MHSVEQSESTIHRDRQLRARAACLLVGLIPEKQPDDAKPITWPLLLAVPEWCFWSESQRYRLAIIAGGLFIAPAIRLWIDADRLRRVRKLLGESVFDAIMSSDAVPKDPCQISADEDLETVLISAGESVLLSRLEPGLQPRLALLLRKSTGVIPYAVARLLANESIGILKQTEQKAASVEGGQA